MEPQKTFLATITSALLLASTATVFSQAPNAPLATGTNAKPAAPATAAKPAKPAGPVYPTGPALPRDPQVSIFGIGSSSRCTGNHPQWMPQMVAIGIRDSRSMYGPWGVEKEEGVFDFTKFDERLAYDESLGVQTCHFFGGAPPWKRATEKGLPMNSLPELHKLVFETVKHFKGRISHFETLNEPPNGTTKEQTGADYAKVVATIYDAAKAANPEAQVGMAAKSAHINYLDQALVGGAKGHFDYITLHPYELLGSVVSHPGSEPAFLCIVPNVRKMLAKRDPAKVNAPVFFTEIGVDTRRGIDKQAQAVIKTYVMGIHMGVACINYYEGMDGDSGPLGLLDAKCNPRPAYFALGKLIALAGRHPTSIGWVMLNDKHYGFMFQGAKGPVLGTWAGTTKPDEVDFGQEVDILDPSTGTSTKASKYNLTAAPVLITDVPEKLVAQARANKNKPIPWGGDYSNAKSVSVTYAPKYEEKGLHTMAADSIAADVLAYGGNARSGEVPKGGSVFYIDPNFLSYDTVPIEITAMVKRVDNGGPVSLAFEYESNNIPREGYSKVPPQEIPEDTTQWHKLTWKIDNCQFTGTWAFHFRIQTDPKKYLMQSLTVTRLDR